MSSTVLGGEIKAHFAFGSVEQQEQALEACRQEQELMTGYPLVVVATTPVHYIDDKGRDIYEMWATFGPVAPLGSEPLGSEPLGAEGTDEQPQP